MAPVYVARAQARVVHRRLGRARFDVFRVSSIEDAVSGYLRSQRTR